MKKKGFVFLSSVLVAFLMAISFISCQQEAKQEKSVHLFSYFINRGQDGLHLAYSRDGLKWEALNGGDSLLSPEIGPFKLMRDPSIVQGPDGVFHMVWTSGWKDKVIGYSSSKDLIHWTEQKAIPVMEHEAEAMNSWAPELFYDEQENEFIILWATTIPGRHSAIVTSEKEDHYNHRIYAVTTKDFNTFSDTKLFFNPNFSAIDATILKRDKKYYMFVKNENPSPPEKNIRITISDNAQGPYPVEVSAPITGNYWAEGPTPLVVGEYVYVYFDKYREHKYGAIRSKDLTTWEEVSDSITMPRGIRHGTTFSVTESFFNELQSNLSK